MLRQPIKCLTCLWLLKQEAVLVLPYNQRLPLIRIRVRATIGLQIPSSVVWFASGWLQKQEVVLVVPYDQRLPFIRARTRAAIGLQTPSPVV